MLTQNDQGAKCHKMSVYQYGEAPASRDEQFIWERSLMKLEIREVRFGTAST